VHEDFSWLPAVGVHIEGDAMKTLMTALALCACAAFLLFAALLTVAVHLMPYLAVGCALVLLARAGRRRQPDPARQEVLRHLSSPMRCYPLPTGQWVYVPVWVERPRRPAAAVIDAELVEEQQ
jgi:hypothetical protein